MFKKDLHIQWHLQNITKHPSSLGELWQIAKMQPPLPQKRVIQHRQWYHIAKHLNTIQLGVLNDIKKPPPKSTKGGGHSACVPSEEGVEWQEERIFLYWLSFVA